MDAILNARLEYELLLLEEARQKYNDQLHYLSKYENCYLKRKPVRKKYLYYHVRKKGEKDFKYTGNANNKKVRGIKEVRHLKEAIKRIDNNISLIKALRDGYVQCDLLTIDNLMYKTYRNGLPHIDDKYHEAGKRWMKEKLKFQAQFPENYPMYKTHRTLDGTLVRTVSEVNLYNTFMLEGLVHIYELPLTSKDYGPPIYPDFTILSPVDLKTEIIVEYVGRLDNKQYREDFAERINRYMRNGYIPGVNLFFVFADIDGNVDSLQISKIVADIKGLR